jgi:hypothetical protein
MHSVRALPPAVKMHPIVTFASGNLAAATMRLVNNAVTQKGWLLRAFTDGVLLDAPGAAQNLRTVDIAEACSWLRDAALLVTSIRSPGDVEQSLIRIASQLGVPSLLVMADLGSGPQKLRDENHALVLPDAIAVADAVTWRIFVGSGVESARLQKVGSPYLDALRPVAANSLCSALEVCFFDVPSDSDFAIWGSNAPYSESYVRHSFASTICGIGGATAVIRPHPKQRDESAYFGVIGGAVRLEPTGPGRLSVEERIAHSKAVVSTYSTALLVARELGRPAISYQPGQGEVVRESLYRAAGIPVARSSQQLASLLRCAVTDRRALPNAAGIRFHQGHSLQVLLALIASMVRRA